MTKSNTKRKPRSPIKSFIRPRPGAVLREQLFDKEFLIFYWLSISVGMTITTLAILICQWLLPPQRMTGIYIAGLTTGWVGLLFVWWRYRRQIRNLQLGLEGECDVAQTLDELREQGYHLIHSIDCGRFDIDHAIVGPTGVYAIETKTISKRGGAEEQVHWDGKALLVGGRALDRDPIVQAQAVAKKLAGILKERTGESVLVQPAVVFPGWFVVNKTRPTDTWVNNPDLLVAQIRKAKPRLDPRQVYVLTNAIHRHQRESATY